MVTEHDPVFCKKPWKCTCGRYNYDTIACAQCGKTEDMAKYIDPCEVCEFKKERKVEIDWRVRDNVKY